MLPVGGLPVGGASGPGGAHFGHEGLSPLPSPGITQFETSLELGAGALQECTGAWVPTPTQQF